MLSRKTRDLLKAYVAPYTRTVGGRRIWVGAYGRRLPQRVTRQFPDSLERKYGPEATRYHQESPAGEPLLVRQFGSKDKRAYAVHGKDGSHAATLHTRHFPQLDGSEGVEITDAWTREDRLADGMSAGMISFLARTYGTVVGPPYAQRSADADDAFARLGPDFKVTQEGGRLVARVVTRSLFEELAPPPPPAAEPQLVQPSLFKARQLLKAYVRGHYRAVDGERVWVKPYTDKRTKQAPAPASGRQQAAKEESSVRSTQGAAAEPVQGRRPVRQGRETPAPAVRSGTDRRELGAVAGRGLPPRAILTARADLLPEVDLTACPTELRGALSDDQVEGVARAITALDHQGGFILADGTGTGKTRQILAVAKHYHDQGLPVLIVAPAEVIKQDWKTGEFHGSYREDGEVVGIVPTLLDGGKRRLGANEVGITTYTAGKRPDPEDLPQDTVVIFDEGHLLKNSTGGAPSATATWGCALANRAGRAMFASATPMDKAEHLPYLAKAGVFEGGTLGQALSALGLEYKVHQKRTATGAIIDTSRWVIADGVTKTEVASRIESLFDRMTRQGTMLKREVSLAGLSVDLLGIETPPEARATLARIEERYTSYNENTGETDLDPMMMAIMLQDQRRHLEPYKLGACVELVKQELAAGRSVVVFCARVNDSESKVVTKNAKGEVLSETLFAQTAGTATALRALLEQEGITEVAELHGGATKTSREKKAAQDRFQAGQARVLITTVESGGTGINLDDRIGDRPRTLICLTAPFTAPGVAQMVGRVLRRTTVSDTRVKFIFANEYVDQWNARIANDKLSMLGASVKGEIGQRIKLDSKLIDWLTDADMPYTFYNPAVKVVSSGSREAAEQSAPTPRPAEARQPAAASGGRDTGEGPARTTSPAATGGMIERRLYTTKKGKAKPVIAFQTGFLDRDAFGRFRDAGGWYDKPSRTYLIGDSPRQAAIVQEITGLAVPMAKSLVVRLFKAYVKQHTRTLSTGKQVAVRAHSDKRTRKAPQYTGKQQTARGNTIYQYSAEDLAAAKSAKFQRVAHLAESLPALIEQTDAALNRPDTPREKVIAAVIALMDRCQFRIGTDKMAEAHGTFGVSTLRTDHVQVRGDEVRFTFTGKKQVPWDRTVVDPRLADLVTSLAKNSPDGRLFWYYVGRGEQKPLTSAQVNAALKPFGITAKDFRTYHATQLCFQELRRLSRKPREAPLSAKEIKRRTAEAVGKVAEQLGHTPAVSKQSYILPQLLEDFAANGGRLTIADPWRAAAHA